MPSPSVLHGVRYTGGSFAAAGEKGVLFTSAHGAAWTLRTKATTRTVVAAAYCSSRWVAVGLGGIILTSEDGAS